MCGVIAAQVCVMLSGFRIERQNSALWLLVDSLQEVDVVIFLSRPGLTPLHIRKGGKVNHNNGFKEGVLKAGKGGKHEYGRLNYTIE